MVDGPAIDFSGSGQLSVAAERVVEPEMTLYILDPTLIQAPTSLTAVLSDGHPNTQVVFRIDGTVVYQTNTDGDGQLQPTSIPVPESVGAAGSHTLSATQVGSKTSSATFTLAKGPQLMPRVIGVDAEPVSIPGSNQASVQKWVLQDLMPGGIGSYILPVNPSTMSQPHFERVLSARHSTATTGQFHITGGGPAPVEWSFEGYCPTQEMHDKLLQFRDLNRRFYLIDHRKRAWKVTFISVDLRARLRQMGMNGVYTDWGHDYTVEALVYDQNPAVLP